MALLLMVTDLLQRIHDQGSTHGLLKQEPSTGFIRCRAPVSVSVPVPPVSAANRPGAAARAPDPPATSRRFDRPDSSCTRSRRRRSVGPGHCTPDRAGHTYRVPPFQDGRRSPFRGSRRLSLPVAVRPTPGGWFGSLRTAVRPRRRSGCVCQPGMAHFDAREWPTPCTVTPTVRVADAAVVT